MSGLRHRRCLCGVLLAAAWHLGHAQQASPQTNSDASSSTSQMAAYGSTGAPGTDAATTATTDPLINSNRRAWNIKPSVSVDFTQTDNVRLQASNPSSDLITRIGPGLHVDGASARVSATADLSLQQINYQDTPSSNRQQRYFNGTAKAELLDNWLYIDLNSKVTRQAISAFGVQSSGTDSINNNVVQTTTYEVAPYIKGRLLGAADYMLRFDNMQYSAQSGPMTNTTVQTVSGSLSGATPLKLLNWSLSASDQQNSYSNNEQNKSNSVSGSLTYAFDPQFNFTLTQGTETNNYVNFQNQTSSITGWGFQWSLSDLTQLTWTQQKRYFGEGYTFKFTHRTPHTAWIMSASRDVMVLPPQAMTYSAGTYFDLLNQQLQSFIPDDAQRTQYILTLLQSMNIAPSAQVIGGFMSSAASVNQPREISFTWTGARNVVTASLQSLDRSALSSGIQIPDDFTNFGTTIKQHGANFNWAYKLTPTASLTLMGNRSHVVSSSTPQPTDFNMYTLTLSNSLGAYTRGSIGVRRTMANGFTSYDENAVLASVVVSF